MSRLRIARDPGVLARRRAAGGLRRLDRQQCAGTDARARGPGEPAPAPTTPPAAGPP